MVEPKQLRQLFQHVVQLGGGTYTEGHRELLMLSIEANHWKFVNGGRCRWDVDQGYGRLVHGPGCAGSARSEGWAGSPEEG
jgi:hypothetical protein